MSVGRHSYVAFYPSDWSAGTARLTRLVKSVYHDICLYNWDKNRAAPKGEIKLMLSDLSNGQEILEALVDAGTLHRNDDGSVFSPRALAEAEKAFQLWAKKSAGGKSHSKTVGKTHSTQPVDSSIEPKLEPSPEPEPSPESPEGDKEQSVLVREIGEAWNAMAKDCKLSLIAKMTDERARRLKARISEHGGDNVLTAIQSIPDSPFLLGQNERGWKANFDWLMAPNYCAKLIEGGYHNRGTGKGSAWTI